ncbi:hypothetical protein [Mycoplasmopsis cynos]|uniref:hypothetical protein n=1 Tax=Mycoplasmopsis cynos TaxID=171284 RepID=UPI0024CBD96E|nr:hypothetical protein [Mycoplasmopsis cynos]WAM04949.1 hypothetical protein ONA01_02045 [Mycoplasmopsis cynos]
MRCYSLCCCAGSINDIDLTEVILKKDEEASKRYKHPINLKEFIEGKSYIFPEKTK